MPELVLIIVMAGAAALCLTCRPRKLAPGLGFAVIAVLGVVQLVQSAVAAGWLPELLAGLVGLTALALSAGGGWYRWTHHQARVTRWGAAVRRNHGLASTWDVLRYGSGWAMRRQATKVRPSLSELTWWKRGRLPVTEIAVTLCRAGLLRVWASVEDVVLVFGIPRYGKSAWLGCKILDAPGAVVTTSTKPDLYRATHKLRGGPHWIFNVTGVAGLGSTMSFDPVSGCADPVTAVHRAEDMLPCGVGDTDRKHWNDLARGVFAGLLHAAALGGLGMSAIVGWVADPEHSLDELVRLLDQSPDPGAEFASSVRQFCRTNDKTRSSIATSIRPALGWLTNPHARAATAGSHQFSVEELLRTRGTVYLLGADDGSTAALVAALTGYIAREARRIADLQPDGRLDPTLLLALDEAANICPIPLDRWSADMGGRGIQIVAAFQSRAQAIRVWGVAGAGELVNNAGGVVLFGGCKDEADLRFWSNLFGERDEEVLTTDSSGNVTSRSVRRVPVFSPAQLAALPKFRVVVWRSSMGSVLGKVERYWQRPEYREQLAALERAEEQVIDDATATVRQSGTTLPRFADVLRRRRQRQVVEDSQDRARSGL